MKLQWLVLVGIALGLALASITLLHIKMNDVAAALQQINAKLDGLE